jgi:pimeloyl-ACP methyl ester carboxylesterase
LQPYAIDIPAAKPRSPGYGLTLLLHSLSANYNQYIGSHNQTQFANRTRPSIVITPEARGPDQFYEGLGAADVFEVWADVARRFQLDPAYTDITGYSMGGIGTFKLGAQYPDLFSRAQPTVGEESNNDVLASLRNVPVLMWNNSGDELVNPAAFEGNASKLQNLGYRYELDTYEPCLTSPRPRKCSPLFPNHLELAINDQYAPAAAFLGTATVDPNPAHITYVYDTERDRSKLGMTANHTYWISGLALRSTSHTSTNGDPEGQVDALSEGFGRTDPTATAAAPAPGTLTGGNLGPLRYLRTATTWGARGSVPATDILRLAAKNIARAAIDVKRAHVDCHVILQITSDGPITVALPGCNRTVRSAGTPVSPLPSTSGATGTGAPPPVSIWPPPLPAKPQRGTSAQREP